MTQVVVSVFGGELPAVPVDSLPPANAQEARNLFAGSAEFRPLRADTAVQSCSPATQTVYRTQRSGTWLLSDARRRYVRGQVDDDTTERTYYTDDTPGTRAQAFDLASIATPRQLGVPPPGPLTVAVEQERVPFLRKDAESSLTEVATAIRSAMIECTTDPRLGVSQQRASRYKNYSASGGVPGAATLVPRNGPLSNYRMGPTEEIVSWLPQKYHAHHATLWAVRPVAEITALFGAAAVEKLGAVLGTMLAVPIDCMPPSWLPEAPDPSTPGRYLFESRMRAIVNPKTLAPLFSEGDIVSLLQVFVAGSRMSNRMADVLRELDDVTREFSALVLDTPMPAAPATERPVQPTKPTVPQYEDDTDYQA